MIRRGGGTAAHLVVRRAVKTGGFFFAYRQGTGKHSYDGVFSGQLLGDAGAVVRAIGQGMR